MRPLPRLLLCLSLAACSEVPELGGPVVAQGGAAPQILPLDALIASAEGGQITATTGAGIAARAQALRARAAAMRGPVHDPATRARLAAALADA